MSYEFIARLPSIQDRARWLVRDASSGALRVTWVISDLDHRRLSEIARMTSRWRTFSHPRVARLHATGIVDERLLYTVDDDRGPSFADAAAKLEDAPVDRERWAIAQLITLADGLAAMAHHAPGFVHQKLEPDLLFVDATGHARLRAPIGLVSFGLLSGYVGKGPARSWDFLSPEQITGIDVTPASDVFALAANLVMALTGRSPFAQESSFATLQAITLGPPPPCPTYAPGLDRILARAFAKDPKARQPDPATFAAELYECVPDAGDYNAVISDRIAAWWPTAPQSSSEDRRDPQCARRWEDLDVRFDDEIRHCSSCNQPVVRVRSVAAALPLLGRHCIAFRPD